MTFPSGTELLILVLVLVVLFGASKLPVAARSIGQSLRIFKAETKGLRGDDEDPQGTQEPGPAAQQPAPRSAQQALPSSPPPRQQQAAPPNGQQQPQRDRDTSG